MEEKKFKLRELKEIFFESEEFAKIPKNLKNTMGKLYFFETLHMISSELPSLFLATATASIVYNKILALTLIIASVLLNSVRSTINATVQENMELKEAFTIEYFERLGNSMLFLTRNRVEKQDEVGNLRILSTTAIVEIIRSRFSLKFSLIDQTFRNTINLILFAVTFGGLIKLLNSQVTDMKFFYFIIIFSLLLKIIIYSKELKKLESKYDERILIKRQIGDVTRDLKEVEPMNNKHITFMLEKLIKCQNKSLEYERKEAKERNKNAIIISFINSFAIIAVILKITLDGGIDSLTAIKFANIITLSQLFSNILASVESYIRSFYRQKDCMSYYRKHHKDYLEVLDVYKMYADDVEIHHKGNTFEVEPFEYTYPNTKFTLKCDKNIILQRGKLTLLKGSSGVGKSTLVKILSGEIKTSKDKKENLSTVKYFNDDSKLGGGNVFEEITLENDEKNVDFKRLTEVIEGIKLENKFRSLEALKKVSAVELSNGMTQRVLLARTLYNLAESDLVVIDEPIGSLDEVTAKEVMEFIKEFCNKDKKRFIIVCTHQYNIIKSLIEDIYEITSITPNLSELK